jgi:tight adherence protein C
MTIGASVILLRLQKKKVVEKRLWEAVPTEIEGSEPQKRSVFLKFMEKVGNFASHGHATKTLWEQLARAGYLSSAAPAIYTGLKLLLFIIGLAVIAILITPMEIALLTKITLVSLGAITFFFIPNIVLSRRLKKRHYEISCHLPEAIDLLEICVSSGIGLEMAWNIVADEIQPVSSVLSKAMSLSNFEIHLGANRVEAMRHMAERTGVEKLSSLAAILVQTERFGTSVGTALRVFAESMREDRDFAAQENAEKMAVKLIVPMVMFIFPAVLMVVAGPAFILLATKLLTV